MVVHAGGGLQCDKVARVDGATMPEEAVCGENPATLYNLTGVDPGSRRPLFAPFVSPKPLPYSGSCCGQKDQDQTDGRREYIQNVGWATREKSWQFPIIGKSFNGPCKAICEVDYTGFSTGTEFDTAPSFKNCASGDYCWYGT